MSASQLMRILQTIPSDARNETCVFDPAKQDTAMKENQNSSHYDAAFFGRDTNPFTKEDEETYQLKGSETAASPLSYMAKDGDHCWNPFMDDLSIDIGNGVKESKHETTDSISSYIETNICSDKEVSECELPEFTVCYKDNNYHIVKDICVDEGLPSHGKFLVGSCDHGENNKSVATEGSVDMEFFVSDELVTSSMELNKSVYQNGIRGVQENGTEDHNGNFNVEVKPKSGPESSLDISTGKHGDTFSDASAEKSFVDKNLPIQDFGTRSFLRSFISSLDSEENKADQQPAQIPSSKEVATCLDVASMESDRKVNIQATSSSYNSMLAKESITFDFNSLEQVISGVTTSKKKDINKHDMGNSHEQESVGNLHEQPLKLNGEKKFNNSSATSQVLSISNTESNNENISVEDGNSGILSVVSSHLQHDEGEASFSASGFVNRSGPIPFSGTLSDGSATSARSFAFPVMQNEWNSSPARMAKADRRGFKGWRSGLLCCRF